MALDKLVDATQLDAALTSVADAIRAKGGTSAQLAFPAGFVSAIGAIPTGGGGSDIILSESTYTFAEALSGSPSTVYPVILGQDVWGSYAENDRRAWFLWVENNGTTAQTNALLWATINVQTSTPPICVSARYGGSGQTVVHQGTGSAITCKFLAGAIVHIYALKNPRNDTM